jgi:hypothetical protein
MEFPAILKADLDGGCQPFMQNTGQDQKASSTDIYTWWRVVFPGYSRSSNTEYAGSGKLLKSLLDACIWGWYPCAQCSSVLPTPTTIILSLVE